MKRLLLLRHGEAEPAAAGSGDFDRPLTLRGRKEALQAAGRLRRLRCIPALIVASPALRARETALILATHVARLQALRYEPACYPGRPDTLRELLAALSPQPHTLLLVGHNPGLSELAQQLAAAASRPQPLPLPELTTGGLCRIELAGRGHSPLESRVTSVRLV